MNFFLRKGIFFCLQLWKIVGKLLIILMAILFWVFEYFLEFFNLKKHLCVVDEMFFNFGAEDDLICQKDHSNVLDDFCSKNFKLFDIGGFLFDDELDLEVVVFYYVGVVNFEELLRVNV